MSNTEISKKLKRLRQLQQRQDEVQAEISTIKTEIQAHMGAQELLQVGQYKVTWQTIESTRLDSSALKKAMPEIYQAFTKTSTSRRFSVGLA